MRRTVTSIAAGMACACTAATPSAPPPECPDTPGRFHDCLEFSGIDVGAPYVLNNGAAVADLDGDGRPEVLTFSFAAGARLWHNLGGFRFEERTGSGLALSTATGARFADLDGDGRLDLVATEVLDPGPDGIPRQQRLRAWRGLEGLTFEEKTSAWGLDQLPDPGRSVLLGLDLADVNGDGLLDLAPRRHVGPDGQVLLYLSEPGPHWTESGRALFGDVAGDAFATLIADADDDGWDDAFFVMDASGAEHPPARLFLRRPGRMAFTEDERLLPRYFGHLAHPGDLMAATLADADADGRLELFLADVGPQHLLRRADDGVFESLAELVPRYPEGGNTVVYSPGFVDFTNDGFPDLLLPCSTDGGNRGPPVPFFLENAGDGTFADRSEAVRASGPTSEQALSVADLDGDGRLDAFLGGSGRPPRLLRNALVAPGAFATLRLRGTTSNAEGLGARVIATIGGRRHAFHLAGSGLPYGDSPHELHLGLGGAAQVEALEIHWPSGLVQVTGPIAAGTRAVVEEPAFVKLAKNVAAPEEPVLLELHPPPGTLQARAVLEPENTEIGLESGESAFTGTVRAGPGLHGIRLELDGRVIPARPQLLVR